jgi:predicted transcriptional regulator
MARKKEGSQLTPLELEIMQILWDRGPSTVQEIRERLGKDLAYNTVQTMLNLLVKKGKADRTLKEKAYQYHSTVNQQSALRQLMDDLVNRVFGGSAENLVMSLVETDHLSPEKLAHLNDLVNRKRNSDDQSN